MTSSRERRTARRPADHDFGHPQSHRLTLQDILAYLSVPLALAGLVIENTVVVAVLLVLAAGMFCLWVITRTHLGIIWRAVIALAVIVICAVLVRYKWRVAEQSELAQNEGVLYPGHDPDPPLPRMCEIPPAPLVIYFGPSVAAVDRFPDEVLRIKDKTLLAIDTLPSSGGVAVTQLAVYDDRNDIVASIDKGTFWVRPDCRRKRPNRSTLIVYDHTDTEVLRIRFLNPHVIQVTGLFRYGGYTILATKDKISSMYGSTWNGDISEMCSNSRGGLSFGYY